MKTVLFLGYKGGGKTRALTILTRALVSRGWRVGTVKHAVDHGLSFDARGKDTWLHAKAGASLVIGVSPSEMVTIRKRDESEISTEQIVRIFDEGQIDYVLVEGFKELFSRRKNVTRVICAGSKKDATDLIDKYGEPLCIVGRHSGKQNSRRIGGVPVLQLPRDTQVLLSLVGSP